MNSNILEASFLQMKHPKGMFKIGHKGKSNPVVELISLVKQYVTSNKNGNLLNYYPTDFNLGMSVNADNYQIKRKRL